MVSKLCYLVWLFRSMKARYTFQSPCESLFMSVNKHLRPVHTRRQVAATCRLNVHWFNICHQYIWFCWCDWSHEIQPVGFHAASLSDKILSRRQQFPPKIPSTHGGKLSLRYVAGTSRCDLSPNVYRPLGMRSNKHTFVYHILRWVG